MADALSVVFERRFPSGASVAVDLQSDLPGGTALVLFGPSGAGKTTIVRAIAGLERPDRGRIAFGESVWFDSTRDHFVEPQHRGVGYVGQESALFPHLSVEDNILYGLRALAESSRRQRLDEVLEMLEIEELRRRSPRELSGGQSRRVAMARALAPRRQLLLVDEPFTGLDGPSRTRLRAAIRSLVRTLGLSLVLVTHDRTDAIAIGDRMAVLVNGRVRQVGPVADVFRRPADVVVAQTVGVESVVPARVLEVNGGLVELRVGAATVRAADVNVDRERAELFACIRAEDVMIQRETSTGGSARNHLPGTIVSLVAEGPVERVTIDCGFPLTALITRNAREEMSLAEGSPVVAVVKATAIHLV